MNRFVLLLNGKWPIERLSDHVDYLLVTLQHLYAPFTCAMIFVKVLTSVCVTSCL